MKHFVNKQCLQINIFCSKKAKTDKYFAFILYSKYDPFFPNYYAMQVYGNCDVLRWHMHNYIMNCGAFVKSLWFMFVFFLNSH